MHGSRTEICPCKAREIFEDPDGPELIEEYAKECAIALIGKPAPRLDMYEGMEATGFGQCFWARVDGKLAGFAMLLVAVVPHYGLACGNLESLYAKPDAACGLELMRRVESYAKVMGCTGIFYCAPARSRLAKLLFLQEDVYTNTNHVFCKRLG